MAICKFCGQESGGTKFCQNCGAKPCSSPASTDCKAYTKEGERGTMSMPQSSTCGKTFLLVANLIVAIISCFLITLKLPIRSFGLAVLGMILSSCISEWNSNRKNTILIVIASICLALAIFWLMCSLVFILAAIGIEESKTNRRYLKEQTATTLLEMTAYAISLIRYTNIL